MKKRAVLALCILFLQYHYRMKEYKIEVTETLSRTIHIEAASRDEAVKKVKDMYRNEEIVLDADDFIGVDIREEN